MLFHLIIFVLYHFQFIHQLLFFHDIVIMGLMWYGKSILSLLQSLYFYFRRYVHCMIP